LTPSNAQVNSLLGELLIHLGRNEQAAEVLEIAYKAAPTEQEHWVRLLAAQHRSGNLDRCRELIALGEGLIPKEQLEMFVHGISQPPANRLDSLMSLLKRRTTSVLRYLHGCSLKIFRSIRLAGQCCVMC
jgi:hypothetical protein